MDGSRFDDLTRSFGATPSRRTVLELTVAGLFGLVARAAAGAKKRRKKCKKPCGPCKRCKKGKCKPKVDGSSCGTRQACVGGSCKDIPPTCSDEVRNGDETDVDCGGSCPQACANGRDCQGDGDCQSGHCVGSTCRECATAGHCPDPNDPCREAVCTSGNCAVITVDRVLGSCNTGVPGVCATGERRCIGGNQQCAQTVFPSAEVCDGLDNDCDGVTDEGFDLQTDANNCGECGRVCQIAHATAGCSQGQCVVVACDPGFADCDGVGGCETPLGTPAACRSCFEVCNPDQSCDPAQGCRCPQNRPNVCGNACIAEGSSCTTGLSGVCSAGTLQCVNDTPACVQTVQPSAEVCDGLDNDCDGAIDVGACPVGQRCQGAGCCTVDGFGAEHGCTIDTECCSGNCATHSFGRTCRPAGCLPTGGACAGSGQACCSLTCGGSGCQ